jgi:hypothetical protein
MSAGKGDKPRNCFSKDFKDNYDCIDWNDWRNQVKKITKILYNDGWDVQSCHMFSYSLTKKEAKEYIIATCGLKYFEKLNREIRVW